MMMNCDLIYVCKTMGNLSGIPVRLYKENEQLFFYSMMYLPKDPMVIYQEKILAINESVSYFVTEHLSYYGIFHIDNHKIIIGPTRFIPNSQQELRDIAFLANVAPEDLSAFLTGMKAIVGLPLERLMQMLCLLQYLITGEKTEISQMMLHDAAQEDMMRSMVSEQIDQVVRYNMFTQGGDNTYSTETRLMDMIANGDVLSLNEWLKKPTTVHHSPYASDPIRQLKNTFISTTTLASRYAIKGGMDHTDAIKLANEFIYKAELLQSPEDITNLQCHVIKTFAEKVNVLKYGEIKSKLLMDVANYIQQHLSSPVTVEEIAEALYMSRPYLSKKFKKETGLSVSEFIHRQKIEEAKRLLIYTDKSLLSISIYLSFSSQSHFTNMFKKMTGQLPREYREQFSISRHRSSK